MCLTAYIYIFVQDNLSLVRENKVMQHTGSSHQRDHEMDVPDFDTRVYLKTRNE